jgi:hypothetical protein
MADNRIYLKHTPTGKEVTFASRGGSGMYHASHNLAEKLEAFFGECEAYNEPWDAYEIEFEVPPFVSMKRD